MTPADQLRQKIENGSALVGVIGLGYVGLPTARAFHDAGHRVLGFDRDASKVADLAAGRPYLKHLGDELYATLAASDRFEATTDRSRLGEPDALLVCVPTPLGQHRDPDLSYVTRAAAAIGSRLRAGQLLVLCSTTYPGTTRSVFLPAITGARGQGPALECGRDFFVAFAPEREDPGRTTHTTRTIPKLVGGVDSASTDLACALFARAVEHVVRCSSAEVAESAKLLENIFRAVNIALVNELKVILDAMGIDVWEVVRAAATKPFGFMPFFPGPGLGGHCIPIDPFYLTWRAKEVGRPTHFIELAGTINTAMPGYVIERLMLALNERGRNLRGASVLVLGLAYKPDIDDVRESPSIEIIERLRALGANVEYSDPHVASTHPMRRHDLRMESVPLTPERLRDADAVIVATAHSAFDYAMIASAARLVVDTRDAMRPFAGQMGDRLVRG